MNPIIPTDLDALAQLAAISTITGAAIGLVITAVVDLARELRGHRRLRRQLDAFLADLTERAER